MHLQRFLLNDMHKYTPTYLDDANNTFCLPLPGPNLCDFGVLNLMLHNSARSKWAVLSPFPIAKDEMVCKFKGISGCSLETSMYV